VSVGFLALLQNFYTLASADMSEQCATISMEATTCDCTAQGTAINLSLAVSLKYPYRDVHVPGTCMQHSLVRSLP
jgi:hypothetical protein